MRFLIDTHCWLWAVSSPDKLRPSAIELIRSRDNTILFSAVSALEIAIKVSLGKLQLPEPPSDYVTSRLDLMAMTPLPVYLPHALRVAGLPLHHGDPFDRLLVAQCQIERVPLMTADTVITEYDVEILWAGLKRAPHRRR
jgi:PIN domain nuclease of toxin-antitoxin system